MKYIGAKDGFVRAPFVIEGLVIGIVGAILPLILLYFMYNKAVEYIMMKFSLLNNIIDFLPVMDVYKTLLPVGLALGAGIGSSEVLSRFGSTCTHSLRRTKEHVEKESQTNGGCDDGGYSDLFSDCSSCQG